MSTNIATEVTTLTAGEVPKWYHAHILKLNLLLVT
jgi:hypothetical protein